jgi:hypothetical protein
MVAAATRHSTFTHHRILRFWWVCGRPVRVCGERDRTTGFTDYLVSKFIDHYDTVCTKL